MPCLGRFTPGKVTLYPLYRRLGGPQGRSGRVRESSLPQGFDHRTVQPVASRYTDWAIPALDKLVEGSKMLIYDEWWRVWIDVAVCKFLKLYSGVYINISKPQGTSANVLGNLLKIRNKCVPNSRVNWYFARLFGECYKILLTWCRWSREPQKQRLSLTLDRAFKFMI